MSKQRKKPNAKLIKQRYLKHLQLCKDAYHKSKKTSNKENIKKAKWFIKKAYPQHYKLFMAEFDNIDINEGRIKIQIYIFDKMLTVKNKIDLIIKKEKKDIDKLTVKFN